MHVDMPNGSALSQGTAERPLSFTHFSFFTFLLSSWPRSFLGIKFSLCIFSFSIFSCRQVCYQRLQSVAYLRAMLRPPHTVLCFRFGAWRPVGSQSLVPGDLVSLAASQGGSATDRMVQRRRMEI